MSRRILPHERAVDGRQGRGKTRHLANSGEGRLKAWRKAVSGRSYAVDKPHPSPIGSTRRFRYNRTGWVSQVENGAEVGALKALFGAQSMADPELAQEIRRLGVSASKPRSLKCSKLSNGGGSVRLVEVQWRLEVSRKHKSEKEVS